LRKEATALLLALVACGGHDASDNIACPAIAGLFTVSIANPPSQPYRVEATAPGQATPQVFNCASGGTCAVPFPGYSPSQATIQVILTASGTVERTAPVTPSYGTCGIDPRCGCRDTTVNI